MTPERWQRIKLIYDAVEAAAPADRARILDRLCGDEAELRAEVEKLRSDRIGSATILDLIGHAAVKLYEGVDRSGSVLDHYRLLRKIGAGGMGEVYAAEDSRLGRQVALKLLTREHSADAQRVRRFQQEARAASALNHPNIVTVHDFGVAEGSCYIVTELVQGLTLRQAMTQRSDPMPLREVLPLAAQIASALAVAHGAGIVHRDIKPENVMLRPDGYVKILDFGLAKLMEGDGRAGISQAGAVMGTPAYMSPEQAQGRPVDGRSDIFSFGALLYELVTGRRAFEGESAASVLGSILRDEPAPAGTTAEVRVVIARCLQKQPADRYATAAELKTALEHAAHSRTEVRPSLAVLPFAYLSPDKENEFFGDGLAEELINALTKIPGLKVIARTSAFALRDKETDLRTIGQRLGVGMVLEGSVRTAGPRIRVTAKLIRIADGSLIWSDRYDREMTDIFAIQDDISQAIGNALKLKLVDRLRSTTNIEAYRSYLKGSYWFQRSGDTLFKAKEAFEQALQHDPEYAPAHSGLAVFYLGVAMMGFKPMADIAPLAASAAERALSIDPTLSGPRCILGGLASTAQYDWKAAQRHLEAAMACEPVTPMARYSYAQFYLMPHGRLDEAVTQQRLALESDPLSMVISVGLAHTLQMQTRWDEAIEQAAAVVDLYPDFWAPHTVLGASWLGKGRLDKAIASLERTLQLAPSFALPIGLLAAIYLLMGSADRAKKLMEDLAARSARQHVSPLAFAVYYAALGQADRMFEYLESAWRERDPQLLLFNVQPMLAPFRSDPRFGDLLRRMNLA